MTLTITTPPPPFTKWERFSHFIGFKTAALNDQLGKVNALFQGKQAVEQDFVTAVHAIDLLSSCRHTSLRKALTQKFRKLSTTEIEKVLPEIIKRGIESNSLNMLENIVKIVSLKQLKTSFQQGDPLTEASELQRLFFPKPISYNKQIKKALSREISSQSNIISKVAYNIFYTFSKAYDFSLDDPPANRFEAQAQIFALHTIFTALKPLAKKVVSFFSKAWHGYLALLGMALSFFPLSIIYRKWIKPTPSYIPECQNLTIAAKGGDFISTIRREEEIDKLITHLIGPNKKIALNPLIIGKAGSGKTNLINGLAARIASGKVPKALKNKKLFLLDLSKIGKGRQWNRVEALTNIFDSIAGFESEIIFFFDEIATAHSRDYSGDTPVANYLKTELEKRGICCIAATTKKEYEEINSKYCKAQEEEDPFFQRFTPIDFSPPSQNVTLEILTRFAREYSNEKISPSIDVLRAVVDKTSDKNNGETNPRKAKKLLQLMMNHILFFQPQKLQQKSEKEEDELNLLRLSAMARYQNGEDIDKKTLQQLIDKVDQAKKEHDNQLASFAKLKRSREILGLLKKREIDLVDALTKIDPAKVATQGDYQTLIKSYILVSKLLLQASRKRFQSLTQAFEKNYGEAIPLKINRELVDRFSGG